MQTQNYFIDVSLHAIRRRYMDQNSAKRSAGVNLVVEFCKTLKKKKKKKKKNAPMHTILFSTCELCVIVLFKLLPHPPYYADPSLNDYSFFVLSKLKKELWGADSRLINASNIIQSYAFELLTSLFMLDVYFFVVVCRRKSDKVSCFGTIWVYSWVSGHRDLGTGRLVYTVSRSLLTSLENTRTQENSPQSIEIWLIFPHFFLWARPLHLLIIVGWNIQLKSRLGLIMSPI